MRNCEDFDPHIRHSIDDDKGKPLDEVSPRIVEIARPQHRICLNGPCSVSEFLLNNPQASGMEFKTYRDGSDKTIVVDREDDESVPAA